MIEIRVLKKVYHAGFPKPQPRGEDWAASGYFPQIPFEQSRWRGGRYV